MPNTVTNFVQLAEGTKEWMDPNNGNKPTKKPLYNGTTFHRVIPDFMIQGGDPLGTAPAAPATSSPTSSTRPSSPQGPGILSMANSGPNTNGSQFFITEIPTPWLDGDHVESSERW